MDRVQIDDVLEHFKDLEDPRSDVNLRHPLISVVVISLMAVLAGAAGPTGIARWANLKRDELLGLLPLPNGIPKKDVYRRVSAPQAGGLSGLLWKLVAVVACRGGGGYWCDPAGFGGGWEDTAAES